METFSKASIAEILQGTNEPAVDFDTGITTRALPIYDKEEGNLLGYVPVFANPNFNNAKTR